MGDIIDLYEMIQDLKERIEDLEDKVLDENNSEEQNQVQETELV